MQRDFLTMYNRLEIAVLWKILTRAQPFTPSSKMCRLCLTEKVMIMHTGSTLNKRTEFFSSCTHKEGLLVIIIFAIFHFGTENCVLVLHFDPACLSSAIF